mmetsp:Transcript_2090/g.4781  ORF Transcript_2090/g.4781 Transcript_2090/m.4781 type:complete len:205 (+) Transcript_2090:142-756(+)
MQMRMALIRAAAVAANVAGGDAVRRKVGASPAPLPPGRAFALPIERPGGRYLTRIQMDRMKKAAAEAAKRAEEDNKLRGMTSFGVLMDLLKTPSVFVFRHKVKALMVLLCGSLGVICFLLSAIKKMSKDLKRKRMELSSIHLILFHRLAALKGRSQHWKKIGEEMDMELKDCRILKLTKVEAVLGMLFDELDTLTCENILRQQK